MNKRQVCSTPRTIHKRKQSQRVINDLDNVDFVPSNVQSSPQEALLFVFEDNEAVIKMIIKGRSPTMRHVFRTHRVALDWLFDPINLDPKIQIKYIDTKNQLADILTSSTTCSEVMSKRMQKDAGEERVTAKSKPMMNLVSRCSERNPDVLASTASERQGKTRHESQTFDISEKLIVGQSDEIYGVTPINKEDPSWKQLSLVVMKKSSVSRNAKVYVYSDSVLCIGKMHQNPQSNTAWEE